MQATVHVFDPTSRTGSVVTDDGVLVPLAPEALEAVLRSLSYVGPALGPAALEALLADARALADAHGGAVLAREIELAWARRA